MLRFILRTIFKLMFKKPLSVAQSKAMTENSAKLMPPLAKDIFAEPVEIDALHATWISLANADPKKAILFLHGGGYITGSLNSYRPIVSAIARKTGARVLLPEYRLAPEYPFPAALDDALASYRWLLDQGFDAKNIIIAGDSAGGGLSLATTLSLRDEGMPLPAGVICTCPWADLTLSGATHLSNAKADAVLLTENMRLWASAYAGDADLKNPLISPVFADFTDFPPLLIQVGGDEILLDDSRQLAEKAKAAGVDVKFTQYDGMWHAWYTVEILPESKAAFDEIGEFVKSIERG